MLKESIIKQLNDHINLEYYSSNLYLQMSAWCEVKGLEGCASFLSAHAREELGHMHRMFKYVHETGALPVIGEIKAPPTKFNSISDLFTKVFDHECLITGRINEILSHAIEAGDHSTAAFLQWFATEQHEEEHVFHQILDKIKIIGEEGSGVFFIDRAIGGMVKH